MTAYLGAQRWKPAVLQDLVFLQRGFDITKAQQKAGDVPVFSSGGLTSWHNASKAKGPGVIIGRKGTLGSVHYSEGDYWPHDTTLWSKSLQGNNARFIYYALKCLGLERFNVGGANPTLNRNHIHDLPIYIPDRSIQDHIVAVLSTYDNLIENNRQRIALLERRLACFTASGSFTSASPATNTSSSPTASPRGGNGAHSTMYARLLGAELPRPRSRSIGAMVIFPGTRQRTSRGTRASPCSTVRRRSPRPGSAARQQRCFHQARS